MPRSYKYSQRILPGQADTGSYKKSGQGLNAGLNACFRRHPSSPIFSHSFSGLSSIFGANQGPAATKRKWFSYPAGLNYKIFFFYGSDQRASSCLLLVAGLSRAGSSGIWFWVANKKSGLLHRTGCWHSISRHRSQDCRRLDCAPCSEMAPAECGTPRKNCRTWRFGAHCSA